MLRILSIVTLVVCALASPAYADNESDNYESVDEHLSVFPVNTKARLARDGYYSETYNVMTSDGYILELTRIPFRRYETKLNGGKASKPAVLLQHGLQSSSLAYVTLGPERSLAYLLADNDYDVWLGNARGGLNSRRHIKWDADRNPLEFFDYSFEDIGMKDLPAMIDQVLKVTGREQLHYVGHSQGGTAFFVLNSMLPEYNKKIASAHLLAGVGYMENFPSGIISAIAYTTNPIYAFALNKGIIEILGPNTFSSLVDNCKSGKKYACSLITLGETLGRIFKAEIVGPASIKQYAHYGQNVKSKTFERWNHGPVGNMLRYGSSTPPSYDISKVTVDVTMHYTISDDLLDEKDVLKMATVIPNAQVRKVARDDFSHVDFVLASDARELIYDYIIEELNKKN